MCAAAATVVSGQNVCSGISIGQPVITFQNVDAQGALTLTGNLVLDNNNDGDLAINKVEVAIRLTGQTATRNVAAQCPATSDSTSITCTFTANIMYGMPVPTSGPLATLYGVVTIGTTPCNGTATTVNASPSATITINSGSNEAGAAVSTERSTALGIAAATVFKHDEMSANLSKMAHTETANICMHSSCVLVPCADIHCCCCCCLASCRLPMHVPMWWWALQW